MAASERRSEPVSTYPTWSGNRSARVLIVDDHPAAREGLAIRISLQPDLEVCGEACDVAEALEFVESRNPDVVIIDISLKTGNGMDLIKRIKSRCEPVLMLVWSMHHDTLYAERALRAGASGYITKAQATEKIIDAIRQVLAGKIYLSESMSDLILQRTVGSRVGRLESSPLEGLADRELEVFQLIGQGLDTQQVADWMHVSPKTVETYRLRIKGKLHLDSSRQLVQRAVLWVAENSV
jgi:DNA-binding NarL/FixJ family response regulator